jgi:hypothetical protein
MGKSAVQVGMEAEERLPKNPDKKARYRAFRDELQREIFDNKNYDVSIVELSKRYGLSK